MDTFKQIWFENPDWWFNCDNSTDKYLTDTYETLLDIDLLYDIQDAIDPITKIIVLDQLPRHIYRNQYSHHIITYFLQKALRIVDLYLTDNAFITGLDTNEFMFFLLPVRHTKYCRNIEYVISLTWERMKKYTSKDDYVLLKRYLKATYKNYIKDYHNQIDLITKNCSEEIDKDLYKNILDFCPEYNCTKTNVKDDLCFIDEDIDTKKPIIISLSGGVDSMVCSYIIKKHFPNSKIVAVHICYGNRESCDKEVLFLKDWCHYINIPLFIRTIKEINRYDCMKYELRDLYETYTRDVRFLSYKSVFNYISQSVRNSIEMPQIILGHNKDDLLENIFTNISHKTKYENLCGMTSLSIQNDIIFIRPLINIDKADIIKFAISNNIPYLPNSTPIWSQRGQIRNNIVPCLDKWDKQFIPSVFYLSDMVKSMYNIVSNNIDVFVKSGRKNDKEFELSININDVIVEDIFWKEVFIKMYDSHISTKSINNLIFVLRNIKETYSNIELHFVRKIMIKQNIILSLCKLMENNIQICIKKTQ
jgi:tRNA(Ile)-lysidine synthetase-like protein